MTCGAWARPYAYPYGRTSSVGEKRCPPRCVTSQAPLDPGGGQFGGEGAAEQRAAAVALAVGADEREGVPGVGPPLEHGVEGLRGALAEGGEVEVEQLLGIAGRGAVQPDVSGRGVGRVHLPYGRGPEVGVAAGAADQGDPYAGALSGLLQGAAECGVQVAHGERLGTPRARLLEQQPCPRGRRGSRDGLVEVPGDGCAPTHRGEPNLT